MLILADDFTGACDAAGGFASALATAVVTRVPSAWPSDVHVLAVDLDVRERNATEADSAVRQAIDALGNEARVFVKIDSTLRGPIAALVDAALEASGARVAIVAPAFPEQGRTFRDGRVHVNGRAGASLLQLFDGKHAGVMHVDRVEDLEHAAAGRQYVLVDAETSLPLECVARAAERHPEWLLVGSAGLARQLAPPTRRLTLAPGSGPLLLVAGSPAAATHAQLARLSASPDLVVFATEPADARDEGQAAAALAASVSRWASEHRPRAVILTGGATAREVSHRLGVARLRLVGELQAGVPLGILEEGKWHGVTVVTKAGGFGTPDTLLDVVRALGVSSSGQGT